ncbi:MAG: glycosyltransferase family 9 protein [Pseudomonadota bacterium]
MARSSDLTRWLDQNVGAVIAQVLARRGSRPPPQKPRRIVFLQPTAIGDTLISSGAITAIAKAHPTAELTLVHGPSNAAAVKMIAARLAGVKLGFNNPIAAGRALRALQPDMVIDLCPWPVATALAARLSGAWTIGFQPAFGKRGMLFDRKVPHLTERHEIENLSAMSEALGAGPAAQMAITDLSGSLPEGLDPSRLILLHTAAGGVRALPKSWPVAHWAALMQGLAARGWQLGLTGVPADATTVDPILAAAGLPREVARSFCGKLSLAELAALLTKVPLLVSIDTGVLHLSAAVQGAAIGLHGPTKAARWGSVSSRAEGLDAPHPAAGYINYGWETHPQERDIMRTLEPDRVLAAIDAKLGVQAGQGDANA